MPPDPYTLYHNRKAETRIRLHMSNNVFELTNIEVSTIISQQTYDTYLTEFQKGSHFFSQQNIHIYQVIRLNNKRRPLGWMFSTTEGHFADDILCYRLLSAVCQKNGYRKPVTIHVKITGSVIFFTDRFDDLHSIAMQFPFRLC